MAEAGSDCGADSRPESGAEPGTSRSNLNVQRPRGPKPTLLPLAAGAPVGCSRGSQHGAGRADPGTGSCRRDGSAGPRGTPGKQRGGGGVQACVSAQGSERAPVRSDWVYWVTTEAV